MCDFTDEERKALTATRSITRHEQGREVLVVLTERETIRYMGYVRRGRSRLKAEREMFAQGRALPIARTSRNTPRACGRARAARGRCRA